MSKKSHFRTPFDSEHAKVAQELLKSARKHFYYIFSLICGKLRWKMFLLVKLSKKQKIFSQFLANFLKSTYNFEHFKKEEDPLSLCIWEDKDY